MIIVAGNLIINITMIPRCLSPYFQIQLQLMYSCFKFRIDHAVIANIMDRCTLCSILFDIHTGSVYHGGYPSILRHVIAIALPWDSNINRVQGKK